MPIPGNLMTTAMAVMPHTDVDRALEAALSLDVPFWPQLPNLNYHEDMYVQAAEHFPGMVVDLEKRTLRFSMDRFIEEYEDAMARMEEPDFLDVSEAYSVVYHRFLDLDLRDRPAIRGQLEGPVSFGFNVLDQDNRPILFDDTVRPFMFEFMAKRIHVQLSKLKQKNPNAFMFIDEPGMQFVFSALSGYGEQKAREDLILFFESIERPRGIHLCGNPDWDFMMALDMDVLSMDVYTNAEIFASCSSSIKKFLDRGAVLVWGMVPTGFESFEKENLDMLAFRFKAIWNALIKKGIDLDRLIAQSMISPATCCLVNKDGHKTVEHAFRLTKLLSRSLRDHYGLE